MIDPVQKGEFVTGQRQRWSLVKKLGEGDAGEVFLVESLLEKRSAILKRPHSSAFRSDILRQARQIRNEGNFLKDLESVLSGHKEFNIELSSIKPLYVSVPALLDHSPASEEYNGRYFIVIEKAGGIDLSTLARLIRTGHADNQSEPDRSIEERLFMKNLAQGGKFPDLLLLLVFYSVLKLFDLIHNTTFQGSPGESHGLIWNDVKIEHLYWEPVKRRLTVIDWGNAQYLGVGGSSENHRHTAQNDYQQFIDEFGALLKDTNSELAKELNWPVTISTGPSTLESIAALKERIVTAIDEQTSLLLHVRFEEADLSHPAEASLENINELEELQQRIWDFAELPDQNVASSLLNRLAEQAVAQSDFQMVEKVCQYTNRLPGGNLEKWQLLSQMARQATTVNPDDAPTFQRALSAGIQDRWQDALWEIFSLLPEGQFPEWWEEMCLRVRTLALNVAPNAPLPYFRVQRLQMAMKSAVLRMEDEIHKHNAGLLTEIDESTEVPDPLRAYQELVEAFESEVIQKWRELEPAPPNSGIGYTELRSLSAQIEALVPGALQEIETILAQPSAQSAIILDAWGRKDFETARRALRTALLWDPQRRRLLQADRSLQAVPAWLMTVRQGPGADEALQDYLTRMELTGRELHNQVGAADWLDQLLKALKQIRGGTRPADLLLEKPEILVDVPWLNEYSLRESLSLPASAESSIDLSPVTETFQTIRGIHQGSLGPLHPGSPFHLQLDEALDTWAPEARGSSARVFAGILRIDEGTTLQAAIKLMRSDQIEYALPLFREEAHILSLMRDVQGITRMTELGFLKLQEGNTIPTEEYRTFNPDLRGELVRYGAEDVQNFLASLDSRCAQGWLPYLALEKRSSETNLMLYCDAGYTHGRFLPLRQSILVAMQICEILQVAHDRNIVYRDHKILHYYWDVRRQNICMIDWNIARRHPEGLTPEDRQFDLVQFGARGLHHIITGRAAPGALPLGPNRPEEIESALHRYSVRWTFDDERLPNRLKEVLEGSLQEGYRTARELYQDLAQIYDQIPEASG